MHAGFRDLRNAMWMNLGRDFAGLGRTPGALADIARIEALWTDTRARFGGERAVPVRHNLRRGRRDVRAGGRAVLKLEAGDRASRPPLTAPRCGNIRLVAEWYDEAATEPDDWLVEDYEKVPSAQIALDRKRSRIHGA